MWDNDYSKLHRDEVAKMPYENDADYNNPFDIVSTFSDYHKNIFIPQVKEVIDNYNVAGIWVDGDAWCVIDDYSPLSEKFIPEGVSLKEHKEYGRKRYMECFKNYVDELHKHKPDFKIINNWAYSTYMPEKIDIDVDYLSADIHGLEPVEHTLIESKMFAAQDRKWDIMSWASLFAPINDGVRVAFSRRSAPQTNQEAAITVSHGGGFQYIVYQNADGSVSVDKNKMFKEVADFMHKRRFLYDRKTVSQVGVFYSKEGQYKDTEKRLYHVARTGRDVMKCISDCEYTADFVMEHQLDDISKYDVMVVSEWDNISDCFKKILVDYAKNGGNLLVVGAEACSQFGKITGADFSEVQKDANYLALVDDAFVRFKGSFIDLKKGTKDVYFNLDLRDTVGAPMYRTDDYGKGKIAYIPFDLGKAYREYEICYIRDYLKEVMNTLCEPVIKVNKQNVLITALKDDDKTYVNLVNCLTPGGYVFDYIPEMCNVDVEIKGKYNSVSMPLSEEFTYEILEDKVLVHLPKLEIHSVIELK